MIAVLFQYSCVSNVDFEISDGNSRIFLYSEFEPNEDVSFRYSTAVGLNDMLPEINPTLLSEIEYTFKKDNQSLPSAFRYDELTGLFTSPHNAQEIEEGLFYTVNSELKDENQIPAISATTYVPTAKPFTSIEELEDRSFEEGEVLHFDRDVMISTDASHTHYEIEAFVYDLTEPTRIRKLDLVVKNRTDGLTNIEYRNSVLVQSKVLNNQFAVLNISADLDLSTKDINEGVILKLKTVTADHYRYHITVAKEIEAIYAPLSEPVIDFTNIENGIGLFSGFSSTSNTLVF